MLKNKAPGCRNESLGLYPSLITSRQRKANEIKTVQRWLGKFENPQ